jgi:hypothetical protein
MTGLPYLAVEFATTDGAVAALLRGTSDSDAEVRETAERGLITVFDRADL